MKKTILVALALMLTFGSVQADSDTDRYNLVCTAITGVFSKGIVQLKNKGMSEDGVMNFFKAQGNRTDDDADDFDQSKRAEEIRYVFSNNITDPAAHAIYQYDECMASFADKVTD